MNIIYVLIPLSILLMLLAIGAFFWAIRNDQFDDLDTPALDILDDDEKPSGRSNRNAGEDDVTEDQNLSNAKTRSSNAREETEGQRVEPPKTPKAPK
ncbi:cbb3-type cytochrome oxidase assembly protein CcoS [Wenzhouxiangella sp. EGI_FJ10409]|uniref:cbb3-type cytochrome oxidase assembly protein CcoS n=1 Tax=Wenzhouxiangella sp. EGI_FJ10409 TaxID=3243767 RepID=UPI0035E14FA8